jgi:hypothetical protein
MKNRNAEQVLVAAIALVKDEYKALLETRIKEATEKFLTFTEDERFDIFFGLGTIGYYFDENNLGFEYDEIMSMLIDAADYSGKDEYADEDSPELEFVDLVTDYLDCFLPACDEEDAE